MLTGTLLSTHRIGVTGEAKQKLPANLEMIPELLGKKGYDTALFTPNPYISGATGLNRGFKHVTSINAVPESYSTLSEDATEYWIEGIRRVVRSRHSIRPERRSR